MTRPAKWSRWQDQREEMKKHANTCFDYGSFGASKYKVVQRTYIIATAAAAAAAVLV